jgi:hypothetical protein
MCAGGKQDSTPVQENFGVAERSQIPACTPHKTIQILQESQLRKVFSERDWKIFMRKYWNKSDKICKKLGATSENFFFPMTMCFRKCILQEMRRNVYEGNLLGAWGNRVAPPAGLLRGLRGGEDSDEWTTSTRVESQRTFSEDLSSASSRHAARKFAKNKKNKSPRTSSRKARRAEPGSEDEVMASGEEESGQTEHMSDDVGSEPASAPQSSMGSRNDLMGSLLQGIKVLLCAHKYSTLREKSLEAFP